MVAGRAFLRAWRVGPLEQETGGQGSPKIFAAEFQGLRKVLFEQILQAVGEFSALVHDGPPIADEVLQTTGGGVFRRPGGELLVMGEQQLGQEMGVLGVVVGATGDHGFAEFFEGDWIDGKEDDPIVGLQEGDDIDGRLFDTEGDAGGGVFLAQVGKPLMKRFGMGRDSAATTLAGAGVNEMEVDLFIGAIQTDEQVEGRGLVYRHVGLVAPAWLDPGDGNIESPDARSDALLRSRWEGQARPAGRSVKVKVVDATGR